MESCLTFDESGNSVPSQRSQEARCKRKLISRVLQVAGHITREVSTSKENEASSVDGSEIRLTTWHVEKALENNGINYQPQLVNAGVSYINSPTNGSKTALTVLTDGMC